jgi:hypothetical protein
MEYTKSFIQQKDGNSAGKHTRKAKAIYVNDALPMV